MLGEHADRFFTTPMPTSISTQAARAARKPEMPAPRPLNASATRVATVAAAEASHASMLPGMGNGDMLPGMGGYVEAPSYAGTEGIGDAIANNFKWVVLGGIALLAYKAANKKPKRRSRRRARG